MGCVCFQKQNWSNLSELYDFCVDSRLRTVKKVRWKDVPGLIFSMPPGFRPQVLVVRLWLLAFKKFWLSMYCATSCGRVWKFVEICTGLHQREWRSASFNLHYKKWRRSGPWWIYG